MVSFSRTSQTRARTIKVNDGEFALDFTNEPGITVIQGHIHNNSWKGHTPLRQSLDNFLEVATGHKAAEDWCVNAHSCAPSVYLAEELHTLLINAQRTYLIQHKPSIEDYDLIIDIFLPIESLNGHRPSLYSESDKKAFAAYVLSVYDLDEL